MLNHFYASIIFVSDVDFFANVGKVPLPKISPSGFYTKEVQTFIDEFIEGTSLNPNLNNESIGADDGIEAPKKNVSIIKFKEFLEENKDWTEWKFSVKIQISIEKEKEEQLMSSHFRLILYTWVRIVSSSVVFLRYPALSCFKRHWII